MGTRDARVAKLGLQSARPQTSPGGAKPNATLIREELELDGQKANHTVSARLAHMAPDRPDIALACGECSRTDLTRLKLVGRYLLHASRVVWRFPFQVEKSIMTSDGLSDADAVGCPKTRRSTSRRCLRVGQHTLATWSSTQTVVSLSSAESEYYSMVSCVRRELGHEAHVRIWTDAAPARGLALRSGNGDITLVANKCLWLQQEEKPGAQDGKDPRHRQSR